MVVSSSGSHSVDAEEGSSAALRWLAGQLGWERTLRALRVQAGSPTANRPGELDGPPEPLLSVPHLLDRAVGSATVDGYDTAHASAGRS